MVNKERIWSSAVDGTKGIVIVDPNGVWKNGEPEHRYILPENLMIYVSVQAQMNPKTEVYSGDTGSKIINVASGKFYNSVAKNLKDATKSDLMSGTDTTHFTTAWTEMYDANRPEDVEGFGISNIEIEINASLLPKIHIEFIDVRGKNLLERGDDLSNPYNVFYVFPYPLFQLTVKGYLGKTIQIPLIMEKAITKFDPSTGSYLISADFKSFTFAMLNDLILLYALIVEKMYPSDDGKTFRGKEIVDDKYKKYYQTQQGKDDIAEMRALGYTDIENTPLDRVMSLSRMFTIAKDISKLPDDGLLANSKARSSAVSAFINELNAFRAEVETLKGTTNTTELEGWVSRTNNFFQIQKDVITQLVDSKFSTEVFNTKLDSSTYIGKDGITITGMTQNDYLIIKTPVVDFERACQKDDSEKFKAKIVNVFHFYPSIKNIVKAIVIHTDAFMELLREKSQVVFTEAQKNAITDTNPSYEVLEVTSGSYRRMPWPEFYKPDTKNDNTGGMLKSYPGDGNAEQMSWGEVDFIDEMYKAVELLHQELASVWNNGAQTLTSIFLLTPLTVSSPPTQLGNLSSLNDDPTTIVNRLCQQILDAVYHNGYLYKTMSEASLYENGIYDIMVKNVINIMLEELKGNDKGSTTLGLLKSTFSSPKGICTAGKLSEYMNKNIDAFYGADEIQASSIKNHLTFINEPHSYQSLASFNTGNEDFTKFQTKYKELPNSSNMGVEQLTYSPAWGELLDLLQFNTTTDVNGTATAAATFTNNYRQGEDIFITRKYEV